MIFDIIEQLGLDELHKINKELRTLLDQHVGWMKDVHKFMICQLPIDEEVEKLVRDTRYCAIGNWYSSIIQPALLESDEFKQIGELHEKLHQTMYQLLLEYQDNRRVSVVTYDYFSLVHDEFFRAINLFIHSLDVLAEQYDPLTGLLNRKVFFIVAEKEFQKFLRYDTGFCFLMVDIDHFKEINDAHGHPFGDIVLKVLSTILSDGLRKYDLLARYGGEEFLICLPETSLDQAMWLAERLCQRIREKTLFIEGEEVRITCSIGVAETDKQVAMMESISRADVALYQAKSQGRDRVIQWTPDLQGKS